MPTPTFDPNHFLQGAKAAYEIIVTAFAEGNRKTLKDLLSAEVYEGFSGAIAERENRGEQIDQSFVGIKSADLVEAELKGGIAQLTVKFVSELISATRDKAGERDRGRSQAHPGSHRYLDVRARGHVAQSELEAGRHPSRKLANLATERCAGFLTGEMRFGFERCIRTHRYALAGAAAVAAGLSMPVEASSLANWMAAGRPRS